MLKNIYTHKLEIKNENEKNWLLIIPIICKKSAA